MPIYVGADPEFFLYDTQQMTHVSAHDLVPGEKGKPFVFKDGTNVMADGTACEFTINPADSAIKFKRMMHNQYSRVKRMLPKHIKAHAIPNVSYSLAAWESIPDDAKELGCMPDYNAWDEGDINPIPNPIGTMRTAGGHLHIGWTKGKDITDRSHLWDCCEYVKSLETYLNLYRPLWEDPRSDRTKMYGKGGAMRVKPYGVEYRALSCEWLRYPSIHEWLYKVCDYVYKSLRNGYAISDFHFALPLKEVMDLGARSTTKERIALTNMVLRKSLTGTPPPFPTNFRSREHAY